jgi:glycosyltransferase involved in cell wall biosynthesis
VNAPRTSFVIPARNAGATLVRTLDSVLAQTDGNWEALVIDDASSDETPAVLAQYAQRDARIVALRGDGRDGAAGARNLGLGQSRGARIVFLDADDWHEPWFLATMQRALDSAPGAVAAYCDHRRVMPDGAQSPVYSEPRLAQAPLDALARYCPVAIHGVLVERAALQRTGVFDTALRSCEDWDLWQRVARVGAWVHVPQALAFYRTHPGSLSQSAEQGLTDAAVVIHRGFGPDARVAAPADHAASASRESGASPERHLAYVALWYHAMAAAQGTAAPRHDPLCALPSDSHAVPAIVGTMLDGVMVGSCMPPGRLAALWPRLTERIDEVIERLRLQWHDPQAARNVRHAFQQLLMQHHETLVSVVVPVYNGQATLDETLRSVRAQTHWALDIVVVDDGSTDGTNDIAQAHAASDARVRVLRQANAGVAAARNAGWRLSLGQYVAFVDADDLWAPRKIELQLEALLAGGSSAGLAYCWLDRIDAAGNVTREYRDARLEGRIVDKLLESNFVGCGSTVLVRRQALIDAGGFDISLRARGGEGCEDWLLNCLVAMHWELVLVRDPLVGYRDLPGSMSRRRDTMLRSHMLMCERIAATEPALRAHALRGLNNYAFWLVKDAWRRDGWVSCAQVLKTLHRGGHARAAMRVALRDIPLEPVRRLRDWLHHMRHGRPSATAGQRVGRPFLS